MKTKFKPFGVCSLNIEITSLFDSDDSGHIDVDDIKKISEYKNIKIEGILSFRDIKKIVSVIYGDTEI